MTMKPCPDCRRIGSRSICSWCGGTRHPFTDYRLPDGQIVAVDSTAAKDEDTIGFTLKGGQIVTAVKVRT